MSMYSSALCAENPCAMRIAHSICEKGRPTESQVETKLFGLYHRGMV